MNPRGRAESWTPALEAPGSDVLQWQCVQTIEALEAALKKGGKVRSWRIQSPFTEAPRETASSAPFIGSLRLECK